MGMFYLNLSFWASATNKWPFHSQQTANLLLRCPLQKPSEEVWMGEIFLQMGCPQKHRRIGGAAIKSSLFSCYFVRSLLSVTDLIICPPGPRFNNLVTVSKATISLCSLRGTLVFLKFDSLTFLWIISHKMVYLFCLVIPTGTMV